MKGAWRSHRPDEHDPESMVAQLVDEHTAMTLPTGDGILIAYSGVLTDPEWPDDEELFAARHQPGRHPGGILR